MKTIVFACLIACLGGIAFAQTKPALTRTEIRAAEQKAEAERKAAAIRAAGWSVLGVRSSQPAAVFQDGEPIQLQVTFDKNVAGTYRIVRVRCAAQLEDIEGGKKFQWTGPLVELGEMAKGTLPALTPGEGGFVWTLQPTIPLRGSFAVYVKQPGMAENLAAMLAVVPPHHPGSRKDFFQMTSDMPASTLAEYSALLQRLGFKWIRYETGWKQAAPAADGTPGAFNWKNDDQMLAVMKQYQFYGVICAGHAPSWAQPHDAQGKNILTGGKFNNQISCPDNKHMGEYENWVEQYVKRYGDTVLMMDLFNEPVEGAGISGYGSTGAHLREMMQHAYAGAKKANKDFMVGGVDAMQDNENQLLCDPNIAQYVDFLTYHAVIRHITAGPYQARSIGKPAYDTESWVGAGVETPFGIINALAMGFKMTHWYFSGSLLCDNKSNFMMPSGATSQAAALNYFLTDMDYAGVPSGKCLPYLFVFAHREGSPTQRNYKSLAYFSARTWPWLGNVNHAPEKCTHEDLQNDPKRCGETWDQILPSGSFSIADPKEEITVYDFDANPMLSLRKGDTWVIPMALHQDFYITCTGGAPRLMELLRAGKIEGLTPVQIVYRDFTERVEQLPPLRITLQNAYNVLISGKAIVSHLPEGWEMQTQQSFQNIPAGGEMDVLFKVTKAPVSPQNIYPFEIKVETDKGSAQWREEIHANIIARGTITIDGNLEDWQKIHAVSTTFFGGPSETDAAIRYWQPYEELVKLSGEGFHGYYAAAYDDDNFYCMLRLNDPGNKRNLSMKGQWYKFRPGTDNQAYEKVPSYPMLWGPQLLQLAFDFMPNADDYNDPADPMRRSFPFRQTDYEYSVYPAEGGGTEVWRLYAPGTFWHSNAAPTSPNPRSAQGLAEKCKAVAVHDGKGWTYEVAIPWTEMPKLKEHLASSNLTNLGLRIMRSGGVYYTTQMRSACKKNGPSWHPYAVDSWSVDTQWGFEKKPGMQQ